MDNILGYRDLLPALQGSNKQIEWAEKIRESKLAILEQAIQDSVNEMLCTNDDSFWNMILDRLVEKQSASYWINHREQTVDEMLTELETEILIQG